MTATDELPAAPAAIEPPDGPGPAPIGGGLGNLSFYVPGDGTVSIQAPLTVSASAAAVGESRLRALEKARADVRLAVDADQRVTTARERLARLLELQATTTGELRRATSAAKAARDRANEVLHRADDPSDYERAAREAVVLAEQLQDRLSRLAPLVTKAQQEEYDAEQRAEREAWAELRSRLVARWLELTRPLAEALAPVVAELAGLQEALLAR